MDFEALKLRYVPSGTGGEREKEARVEWIPKKGGLGKKQKQTTLSFPSCFTSSHYTARPALSQFQSLRIRRLAKFMQLRNVVGQILKVSVGIMA